MPKTTILPLRGLSTIVVPLRLQQADDARRAAGDAEDVPAYAIMTAPAPRLSSPNQSGDRGAGRTGPAAPAALHTCPVPQAARLVIRLSGRHSEASIGGGR